MQPVNYNARVYVDLSVIEAWSENTGVVPKVFDSYHGGGWTGYIVEFGTQADLHLFCRSFRPLGESVLGNHDHYTLMVSRQPGLVADDSWRDQPVLAGIAHAARQLSAADLGWLAGLEMMIALPGAVLAHASLHGPGEWNYLGGPASALPTLELLRQTEVGLGFFGHIHRQEIFFDQDEAVVPEVLDGRRTRIPLGACCAVLVGSVGHPRWPKDIMQDVTWPQFQDHVKRAKRRMKRRGWGPADGDSPTALA